MRNTAGNGITVDAGSAANTISSCHSAMHVIHYLRLRRFRKNLFVNIDSENSAERFNTITRGIMD